MRSVGWITCLEALKRKWRSSEWVAKQWIRMYYTAGSHQYLFVMSVWGINWFANLYSPQLIPMFLHERFCSTMRTAQLLNGAIKNSESHGPLEIERQCKLWYQLTNHETTLPSKILQDFPKFSLFFTSPDLYWVNISLM